MYRGDIPLTQQQQKFLDVNPFLGSGGVLHLPNDYITTEQILFGVSTELETGHIGTDLWPGGDSRTHVELSDHVGRELGRGPVLPGQSGGPTTVIQKQFNNYGTNIEGRSNPLIDDIDGRDRQ